jgi:mannose-6-phosphate isomerase
MDLYPFKFEPILKKLIWGGSEICRFKNLKSKESGIGESWELSQVPGSVSVISNGTLKGKSLTDIILVEPQKLLGNKVFERFGNDFPLLIKFIDAEKDLSIQVHPNDELARKRHNSFGKTEMWYVIASKPGSRLISGFSKQIDAEKYERRIVDGSIEEVLQSHETKPGDVFFLPAGRVHAIGSGLFIAEIQQSSDITYRLYDYKRKDAQGNERELHTEQARDAIDYNLYDNLRANYQPLENDSVTLVDCKYFITNRIHLKAEDSGRKTIKVGSDKMQVFVTDSIEMDVDHIGLDSFKIYICIEGEGDIRYKDNYSLPVRQGETVLIPSCIESITLCTDTELLLLETYIP